MKATIFAIVVLAFSVNDAFAVSRAVKIACRDDYFAHCSMHAVGSPGVRKCMTDVGPRLSAKCIGALAAAGEVGKAKAAASRKYAAAKVTKKVRYANKQAGKKQYAKTQSAKKKYANATKARKVSASKNSATRDGARKRYVKENAKRKYARAQLAGN